MKKILVAGAVIFVVVLVIFRQRLYLRDPIARVERNGMIQCDYRVYLNYYNDILVEDLGRHRLYLVQAKDGLPLVPGVPLHLQCFRWTACLTEADFAETVPLGGKEYVPGVEMTNAYVTYQDGDGAAMRVGLR